MSQARALPPNTIAPWGEVFSDGPPMTVADLLALRDDGQRVELVDGRLVRVGGSSYRATRVAGRLFAALLSFVLAQGLGDVTPPDGTYDLDASGRSTTGLVPDVGFISADHLPLIQDPDKAIPFAPDLAAEVASTNQSRQVMGAKARRYLAAGTRLVWIVYPRRRQVDVWHAGDAEPTTLGIGDALDGENVVPDFRYPVADLFV